MMASSAENSTQNAKMDKRQQVMVGQLPPDFLRLQSPNTQQQIQSDAATAQMLQQAEQWASYRPASYSSFIGNLNVTLTQAKLAKNYGLTKMDPYCRIRMGHMVYETPTATSGAKNPRWNKSFVFKVPQGVDSLYIEIYDERTFNQDERIAWAHINIPASIFQGDTIDDWYTLNGKQGDEKEGMINLVLTFTEASKLPQQPVIMPTHVPGYVMSYPGAVPVVHPPYAPQHQHQHQHHQHQHQHQHPVPAPEITDEDVTAVKEVFPDIDEEVVRSVLEMHQGDKDATINALLQMASESQSAPAQSEN